MEYVYFMSISLAIITLYLVVSFYKQNKLKESFADCNPELDTSECEKCPLADDDMEGEWGDLGSTGGCKRMDGHDKCSRRFVMNLEENRYEMCESDGDECVRKAWCDNDDGDGDDGDGDDGDCNPELDTSECEKCPLADDDMEGEWGDLGSTGGCKRMDGHDKCSRRFVMNLEENRYEMCESDGDECVRKAWCDNDDGDGDDGDGGNNNGANPSSADPVYISNHNAPQCPEENGGNCPGRRSNGAGPSYPGESLTNYRGNVCYYQYGGIGAKCSDIDKKDKCSTKIRTGDGSPSFYTDGVEPERTGRYVVDSNGVRTYCEWDNENDVCGEYVCTTTEPEVVVVTLDTVTDPPEVPDDPYIGPDADDIDHSTSNNWNEKCKTRWGSPDAWEGACESVTDAEQCKTGNMWVLDKNGRPYLCKWNPENEKCMNKESCFLGTVNLDYKNGLKSVRIGGTSVFNGCDSFEDEDEKLRCQLALSQEKMHI